MSIPSSIVWLRQDLRTEDNPSLQAAIAEGGPIIPVFIWAPDEEGEWPPGAASRWWLHQSLEQLNLDLAELGLKLLIRKGSSLKNILEIVHSAKAGSVFWNQRYEPASLQRDKLVMRELKSQGLKVGCFNGSLLLHPEEVLSRQNTPFKVFTPFWNCCLKELHCVTPLPKIKRKLKGCSASIDSETIQSLGLLPHIPWDTGLKAEWKPGQRQAHKALKEAVHSIVEGYSETRDRPDMKGVSKLSPYLHFGEISPRQVWHAVQNYFLGDECKSAAYLRQIGWREFGYYLLYHFPYTTTEPMQAKFVHFEWKGNDHNLSAWKKGLTGYPFVDAGMRQLWHTGWMHNRVRMAAASFLVKDLMLPWQLGARWFWDTLVDADLANNTLGWQWTAGCGADAAPYFRVFNPTSQGEKFDVTREYVKTWVPELKLLSPKWIYKPWLAPKEELQQAGIVLGRDYPFPIVDHDQARVEALSAFKSLL